MPAAVYLLDLHKPGEDVRNYLGLVAPVLSSRDNIKVGQSVVCVVLLLLWSRSWWHARGLVMGMFGCCAAHVVPPAVACP